MQRIELKSIPNTTTTCSHPTAKVADHPKKGRQEQQCPIKECPRVATVEKKFMSSLREQQSQRLNAPAHSLRAPAQCRERKEAPLVLQ